jgi:hypothetical protein
MSDSFSVAAPNLECSDGDVRKWCHAVSMDMGVGQCGQTIAQPVHIKEMGSGMHGSLKLVMSHLSVHVQK